MPIQIYPGLITVDPGLITIEVEKLNAAQIRSLISELAQELTKRNELCASWYTPENIEKYKFIKFTEGPIKAIKTFRAETNTTLYDAKTFIDSIVL